MKTWKKHYFTTLFILAMSLITVSCDKNNSVEPTSDKNEYGWGKTMAGNDPEELTWPDLSENYWEYTFDLSKYPEGNIGIRFKGEFPNVDTRFFNLTAYSDATTERFGSIEDISIDPEKNNRNPFREDGVSGSNYFEVNAVPNIVNTKAYKNTIVFPVGTGRITFLLRIYFNDVHHKADFGGVALPRITYFDINTGEEIGEAPRAKSLYYERFESILSRVPIIKTQSKNYFTLAPNVLYPNGPTGYVTTANRMHKDSLLTIRFLPPVHPEKISDYPSADVRYWSICVGDTATHTRTTLVDREILKDDDGYVNVIVVDPNNNDFAAIKGKAEQMNINLVEWNVQTYGEPLMIFYRQMYIRPDYEYSVQKIISFPKLDSQGRPDPTDIVPGVTQLANFVLGVHGPLGYKKDVSSFLSNDFRLSDMRPLY